MRYRLGPGATERRGKPVNDQLEFVQSALRRLLGHYGGGRTLDGASRQIHVAGVILIELHDEDAAIPLGPQQSFLDQPLHCLADRAPAHTELPGKLYLGKLSIGWKCALKNL